MMEHIEYGVGTGGNCKVIMERRQFINERWVLSKREKVDDEQELMSCKVLRNDYAIYIRRFQDLCILVSAYGYPRIQADWAVHTRIRPSTARDGERSIPSYNDEWFE